MNSDRRWEMADSGQKKSASDLMLRVRSILVTKEFDTEERRKAALRRAIHTAVVGLDEEELGTVLDELRRRFPDRALDASLRSHNLETEALRLRSDLARIWGQHDQLRRKMKEQEPILDQLQQWVCDTPEATLEAEVVKRFFLGLRTIMDFVEQLDHIFAVVDASLRTGSDAGEPSVESLDRLLARHTHGGPGAVQDLARLSERLERIRMLPEVLLRAAEQSWNGTREVLDQLDPKSVEAGGKIFKKGAILEECSRRFEEFRNQLEQNIEHYYRRRFEQVYAGKMPAAPAGRRREERP